MRYNEQDSKVLDRILKTLDELKERGFSGLAAKLIEFLPEAIERQQMRELLNQSINDAELDLAQEMAKKFGRELLPDEIEDIYFNGMDFFDERVDLLVEIANLLPEPKRTTELESILRSNSEIEGIQIKGRHMAAKYLGKEPDPCVYLNEFTKGDNCQKFSLAIEFIKLFGKDKIPPRDFRKLKEDVLKDAIHYSSTKNFFEAAEEELTVEMKERIFKRFLKEYSDPGEEFCGSFIKEILEDLERPLNKEEAYLLLFTSSKNSCYFGEELREDYLEEIILVLDKLP